jgi:hypothetical protein
MIPESTPKRGAVLDLLASWHISMEVRKQVELRNESTPKMLDIRVKQIKKIPRFSSSSILCPIIFFDVNS